MSDQLYALQDALALKVAPPPRRAGVLVRADGVVLLAARGEAWGAAWGAVTTARRRAARVRNARAVRGPRSEDRRLPCRRRAKRLG